MECKSRILVLLVLFALIFGALPAGATVIYVALDGNNTNGSSWANAYTSVQGGINAASSGDEVWVKAGTYTQCITLKNGVGLYGGFDGAETLRSERDRVTNVTILDGTNGSTSVVSANSGVTASTIIDGFTITHGSGTVSGSSRSGGGIICLSASPTISNNKIIDNCLTATSNLTRGGGIFCSGSSPIISNNEITGNHADSTTTSSGAGMYIVNGAPAIQGNIISENTASCNGGGINCSSQTSVATVTLNEIRDNQAGYGGGINCSDGEIKISNNIITGNEATAQGGGIYCNGNTEMVYLLNNLIAENEATSRSGAIYSQWANITMTNNTIVANTGGAGYAAIMLDGTPTLLTNNIVALNSPMGIHRGNGAALTFYNNDVWSNTGSNYYNITDPTGTDGNISSDPLFVDSDNSDNSTDYRLTYPSLCIDTGDDNAVDESWTDLDGGDRQLDILTLGEAGDLVDMGAYERWDTTMPSTPTVTDDGNYLSSLTSIHVTWSSATDSESGIYGYRYCIGTTSGGNDVVDWSTPDPATATEVTVNNLTLTPITAYYISVKAVNGANSEGTAGVSDGIYCPDVAVGATGGMANRHVVGLHQNPTGQEFWNWGGKELTSAFELVLNKYMLGTVRSYAAGERIPWLTDVVPLFLFNYQCVVNDGWSQTYPDEYGHGFGVTGLSAMADVSDAAVCMVVNMSGGLDSYSRETIDASTPPTNDEKANWDVPDDPDSIYEFTRELAGDLASAYSSGDRVYEFGNEVASNGLRLTEAYWKEGSSDPERIAYGSSWYHDDNDSSIKDYLSLDNSDFNMTLDWSAGHTGTGSTGNVLYIGYPYKPWAVEFQMNQGGVGGTLVWEYLASDGQWKTMTPTGGITHVPSPVYGTYVCRADDPNTIENELFERSPGVYSKMKNLLAYEYEDPNTYAITEVTYDIYRMFLLPLPDIQASWLNGGVSLGYEPEYWAEAPANGGPPAWQHYSDWVRMQPTELEVDDVPVRKLYWLRLSADTAFTTSPVEGRMWRYWPDYRSWLDSIKEMNHVIRDDGQDSGDPDAKTLVAGPYHLWDDSLGYFGHDWWADVLFQNRWLWHFLQQPEYVDMWDGIVIHPYVSGSRAEAMGRVDVDNYNGLLHRIDEMRNELDDAGLTDKKIAITEWGINPDTGDSAEYPYALSDGLYCLDGSLSMMTSDLVSYAAWHQSAAGKGLRHSPFFLYPNLPTEPADGMQYIQRPVGLAMQLMQQQYRPYYNEIQSELIASEEKVFAFSGGDEPASMVILNKTSSAKQHVFCWPAVVGKDVYATYLKSIEGTVDLSDNNDSSTVSNGNVIDYEVVLRGNSGDDYDAGDYVDTSMVVANDGSFTITVAPYSAVGLEFRD
ncbi:MAG: fibronectin type III domain-containing protein [Armatimonadota bacterium]|nr:fibronectin type III domain-containing protein [bacterium]